MVRMWRRALETTAKVIATVGGLGYSPIAPGTLGTFAAVPLALACRDLDTSTYVAVVLLISIVGIVVSSIADHAWGTDDSGRIVIDEVAGYLVTTIAVDRGSTLALGICFVLFRFFDIVKPPPIRWIDRNVGGGIGVMLDDLVAGVCAGVVAYLVMGLVDGAYLA